MIGHASGAKRLAKLFSYIVKVDSGFAPNPFHGYCTLATCKPVIRRIAKVGDWIVGTSSKSKGRGGRLVFAMRVEETMTFQEYWEDRRFRRKRPDARSTPERACGDNIYYRDLESPQFRQLRSFHNRQDGSQNRNMLIHDTKVDRVLVSTDFIYWGGEVPSIPEFDGESIVHTTHGHRSNFSNRVVREFVAWIRGFDTDGFLGAPLDFRKSQRSLPDLRSTECPSGFQADTSRSCQEPGCNDDSLGTDEQLRCGADTPRCS